jgi:hypothetical protein
LCREAKSKLLDIEHRLLSSNFAELIAKTEHVLVQSEQAADDQIRYA